MKFEDQVSFTRFHAHCSQKYIEVISRAGGPSREKLCPRSWMYGPSRFSEVHTFKTEDKVFLDTDRPRPGNNIFIFLLSFTSGKCMKNRRVNQECFYCGATCAKKLQEYHSNALTNVKNCQCHTKYGEVILKTSTEWSLQLMMSRAVWNPAERSGS